MNPKHKGQARAAGAANSRLRRQLRSLFGRRCRLKPLPRFPKNLSHYELQKEIGAGGRGTVYLARDRRSHQVVAMKLLRRSTDRESRLRFLREAACASAIAHPNVVAVYEIVQDRGSVAIAMEYVRGKTLDRAMRGCRLPLKTCLDYALQIIEAVAAIHSASMVHRDLKPTNFIVTKNGTIKLLDFGLTKIIGWRPSSRRNLSVPETPDGTILGTPAYMAPEQALGREADQRSDVFSVSFR